MVAKVNIWHRDETPGFDKTKREMGFNRWRILVVERTAQLTGNGTDDAVQRLHAYGLKALGLDYENLVTAEDLSQKLAGDDFKAV